jgi:arylsulfatase A-like enzyme
MRTAEHRSSDRVPAATRAWLLVTALLLVLISGCGKEPRYNVVIVTIDTLRSDRLGCYGYGRPTSPRIDRFADGAALFENVVCQSSQTLPSHTSIFLGTHPRTHLAISHESVVGADQTTLAEILKSKGYVTAAFISSHALDSKYGLDQGFETYWEVHKEATIPERQVLKNREADATTKIGVLPWLEQHAGSRFFLWVHWFHPHRPYDPPPRYHQAFAGDYKGSASSDPEFIMKVWHEEIELAPQDVAYLSGCYDGEVAFSDAQVGHLLDALSSMGLMKNTIVIVTADHGELLYEHERYFGHDIALYDECIMIPLIIHVPGEAAAGRRISELVQSLDILPTVCDLLGIRCPRRSEGKSLVPLMNGSGEPTTEVAFSETYPFPEKCEPRHAVRTADEKLIWKEVRQAPLLKEYYDLAADPGETANLYPYLPSGAVRLDSILSAWTEDGGLRPAPIPTAMETNRINILKSLGYLE